ncbi:MAG: 23S rRNA (guanosine(2251)-2'-O)-methyltransferase RlmB [Burkholderiaceae bacterium]
MIVHGFHAVGARIRRDPQSITELYVDADRQDARMRDLLGMAERAGLRPIAVASQRLDRLGAGRRHQGVVAIAEASLPALDLETLLDRIEGPARLLVLDGVTDPRNLGACLRVADGAGAHAVIAPKDHASPLNDAAIQTASGAAESMPYIMVTNLSRAIDAMQEKGVWVVGTDDEAESDLYDADLPDSIAWVLGAEGRGLRRLTRERCDLLVRIPMAGVVSSLNVAVACGVVLYEGLRRARSLASPR